MLSSFSPSRSLGSKLILFFLLGSVIPMILLTVVSTRSARVSMLEVARDRIEAQVEASVNHIDSYLEERRSDAEIVAALPATVRIFTEDVDADKLQDSFDRLRQICSAYNYSAGSLVDISGKVVITTDPRIEGQDRSDRPEFQAAIRGEVFISDLSIEQGVSGEYFFHTVAPVYNAEEDIVGAVDFRVGLDQLNQTLDFDTNRTGEGSYGVLMDENLIRISIPSNPEHFLLPTVPLAEDVREEILEKEQFGERTASLLNNPTNLPAVEEAAKELDSGRQNLVFFTGLTGNSNEQSESVIQKLETKDWYYLHRVPEASFYSSANTQTTYAIITTVVAAVVAITAMVWFSRQTLNRPLEHLVEVARSISEGNLGRRISLQRQDEFGDIAESFNAMADNLEKRISTEQASREEAIQLRTTEENSRKKVEDAVAKYLVFVQEVANGNLEQRLNVTYDGSLGELGSGLNRMVDSLRNITLQVKEATTNITSSAAEILSATTQQASSASEQSSATTEAITTVEEVKNIAQQTAQQAGQVSQDSQATLQVSRDGTRKVEESIKGMGQIRQRVESIAQTILALSEQTQAIGTIITTVSELADQSNLLALNAAIEAARAGEQGKSFAVVAQHVRELAERSKAATSQVQEILGEIQRATNAAVMVTEEGTKGVEMGVKLSEEAGQVIHQIAGEVEGGAQSNSQMAAAAHQQTAGMEQIGQAMRSIQQATTQTLSSTRQAETAARDLNNLAKTLQDAILIYRL